MIDKILEYKDEFVSDSLKSLTSYALDPKNIQRLKNNPKLVKKLTENKLLPSSIRLYVRNIAGVTDKITEDFFSKSELAEIKKRVANAEAQGSMGSNNVSGQTASSKQKNTIGYSFKDGKLSLEKALTDPAINIDMTLGQASFSKDNKGNYKVTDIHNFDSDPVGAGYENKEYFKSQRDSSNSKAIPHLDQSEKIDAMLLENQDKPGDSDQEKNYKMFQRSLYEGDGALSNYKENDSAVTYQTPETDKQLLNRAYKAHAAGDIGSSQLARILGKLEGTNIPVELGIGSITQEDKYEANPDFAEFIANDGSDRYENVGIPTLIKNLARNFMK